MEIELHLLREERDLILKYGYPFEQLEKALAEWPSNKASKHVAIEPFYLSHLIGELSRSINHGEAGTSRRAINDLIDRLEYIEQTGDGELDTF